MMEPEKCPCGRPGEPSFFGAECAFCAGVEGEFNEQWAPFNEAAAEYIEKTKEYGDV